MEMVLLSVVGSVGVGVALFFTSLHCNKFVRSYSREKLPLSYRPNDLNI